MATIRDVVRFLVGVPVLVVEPGGFGVVGVATNFYVMGGGEREQSGVLLGRPVVVRFVPVGYRWDYGDGGTRTSSGPGAAWRVSGVASFTRTGTSHEYAQRGSYMVSARVVYTAWYQFAGQGWAQVDGTLELASTPVEVTIKAIKVELVPGPCTKYPNGPGCNP